MKRIGQTVVVVAASFAVTLLINATLEYLTRTRGEVSIGPMISVGDSWYVPFVFTNFEHESMRDLRIAIPSYCDLHSVITSQPVSIEEVPGEKTPGGRSRVVSLKIEELRQTTILVPLKSREDADLCSLLNVREKGLTTVAREDRKSPFVVAARDAALSATIYAVLVGLAMFYLSGHVQDLRKKIDDAVEKEKQEHEKAVTRLSKMEEEVDNVRDRSGKAKVLLLARLSDYAKELEFWRDAIRRLLSHEGGPKKYDAEEVINEITKTLKTYGTMSRNEVNIEALDIYERFLASRRVDAE